MVICSTKRVVGLCTGRRRGRRPPRDEVTGCCDTVLSPSHSQLGDRLKSLHFERNLMEVKQGAMTRFRQSELGARRSSYIIQKGEVFGHRI